MQNRFTVVAAAALLLALASTPALLPVAGAHHHAVIQPGARMTGPAGCTMSFVFEDADGAMYIATAGHCVGSVGQRVSMEGVGQMGNVVYDGPISVDCALVRIDADKYGLVDPAMRHWGGPLGIAEPSNIPQVVYAYGYGAIFQGSELLRPRAGEATQVTDSEYYINIPVYFGDSGGPYMGADGSAIGIVSRLAVTQLHTVKGATVAYCIDRAEAATGLDFTMLTAPLTPAGQRELDQLQHELS